MIPPPVREIVRDLAVVVGALAALMAFYAYHLKRKELAFKETVARHGLENFSRMLLDDVQQRRRPMNDLSLTRMMVEILDEHQRAAPQPGQLAVVVPPDEGYRTACEELVKLGRLTRGPDGSYLPLIQ